jgi:hypothetical protein
MCKKIVLRGTMAQFVYLDTNAFRYFGTAFRDVALAADLRDKILLSPLSAFEGFAQLAYERDGRDVLNQIHTIRNWTNTRQAGLLPWPDEMLYQLWFQKPLTDDDFTKRMQEAFDACLTAESVDELKAQAVEHRRRMDDFKLSTAQQFKSMIDIAKEEEDKGFDMTREWYLGIARRVHAAPDSRPISEIVAMLGAYHEFEEFKLQSALSTPKYNPLSRRNQNDIIDSEQLVYLGDTSLCMLTADGGFKKVRRSEQATRIIHALPADLSDPSKATVILRTCLLT